MMTHPVSFLFGIHNHQPVGNFDFVFEKAYQKSYLPFLERLERHPAIRWNLHASGILWEWLERNHADYLDRVAAQISRGQIEVLTGAYYEPILSVLPEEDQIGQIQKLSSYLHKRFGVRPSGLWLAERVWEPHMVKVLAQCGVEYVLLDDSHFVASGLDPKVLTGSFVTEDQGHTVRLLPIRQDLRYAIPFKDPQETLSILRSYQSTAGEHSLLMADDGEKFGLWPETYKHVYEQGWLDRFLQTLEDNGSWIRCERISDFIKRTPPKGRVYLPTASYAEMGEWALPEASQRAMHIFSQKTNAVSSAEERQQFIRGGFWRNFLSKYDESNQIHKKMIDVSRKVHAVVDQVEASKKSKATCESVLNDLWAGQCNCAYWHGVFGGLYLPHLRQALYQKLLQAEKQADALNPSPSYGLREIDFDADGQKEVLWDTAEQNLYFRPHRGGSLFEWDLRSQAWNACNVLTRRSEYYHEQLKAAAHVAVAAGDHGQEVKSIHDQVRLKEPDLDKKLFSDWYQRCSLIDHFLHPQTTLDAFQKCQYGEQGDFVLGAYQAKTDARTQRLVLTREGGIWAESSKAFRVTVVKTITLIPGGGWEAVYEVCNYSPDPCETLFGIELNLAFMSPERTEILSHPAATRWQQQDRERSTVTKCATDRPATWWEFPLETISLSEEGFERTYQGTMVMPIWPVRLEPNACWKVKLRSEVQSA